MSASRSVRYSGPSGEFEKRIGCYASATGRFPGGVGQEVAAGWRGPRAVMGWWLGVLELEAVSVGRRCAYGVE